jgi:hypothetical protein
VVVYGTTGSVADTDRNRREAQDFARGWNAFMVHGAGVEALPEDLLAAPDLQSHALVIFGTENSSRLLHEANARYELPVHVRAEGVTVRDPQGRDRKYLGPQFGAFLCYPNPLTDFKTYLVVCRGQWATKPDGSARQGLEYDLEKLPWGYSDYVVFNTDQAELPHVLNVNDKPPVTCYEAGYFVEAGYFDQSWQPYRAATLDRLNALKLPVRRISVGEVSVAGDGVTVAIVDDHGEPVNQARVTVSFADDPPVVRSGVTREDGQVKFPWRKPGSVAIPPCNVVNVMATGGEYDWTADAARGTDAAGVSVAAGDATADENGRAVVNVTARSEVSSTVTVSLQVPGGMVNPPIQRVALQAGQPQHLSFTWDAAGLSPGLYAAQVLARSSQPNVSLTRPIALRVGRWPTSPLRLTEAKGADLAAGKPYSVTVRVLNAGSSPQSALVRCAIVEDRIYFAPRRVTVKPGQELLLTYAQPPGQAPLPVGMHTVRACVPELFGVTAVGDFTVR